MFFTNGVAGGCLVFARRSSGFVDPIHGGPIARLGSPVRLEIYRLLVKTGPKGLAVGDIQRQLEIAGTTLSHHISHLVQNHLVHQIREGRVLRCHADYQRMNQLIRFLSEECCSG